MTEEQQFVEKLKQGDNQAFSRLVDGYGQKIMSLCYGFVRNQEDAEEVAQDVFVEVFRSIANYRGEAKLSTWVYRIAVSRSLNKVKKNKFKNWLSSFENLFDQQLEQPAATNPHQQMQAKEDARIVQKTIDRLTENQRIAFVMHHYEGYSYQQIAEIMNTSLSSVESLIHRAKVNLKKQLIHLKS